MNKTEAYYFGTHRVVEYHVWAKSIDGELVRAYGYLGESEETIINQGEVSKEELENNLIVTDLETDEPNLPDEEDVLLIAKKWTVDPLMESGNYQKGTVTGEWVYFRNTANAHRVKTNGQEHKTLFW